MILIGLIVWGVIFGMQNMPTNSNTASWTGEVSEQTQTASLSEALAGVPAMFRKNSEYVACMTRSSDQCMQEAASFGTGMTISCDDYLNEYNKQNCIQVETTQKAVEASDLNLCDSLGDNSELCRYEVISQQALNAKDPEMCGRLDNTLYVGQCRQQVVIAQAVEAKDPEICKNMYATTSQNTENTGSGETMDDQYEKEMQEMNVQMCQDEVNMNIEFMQEQEAIENTQTNEEEAIAPDEADFSDEPTGEETIEE